MRSLDDVKGYATAANAIAAVEKKSPGLLFERRHVVVITSKGRYIVAFIGEDNFDCIHLGCCAVLG